MKRFVKQLLPLGALLAVAAMPIQAAAAEQPNLDLNEALKDTMQFKTQYNNTYDSNSMDAWNNVWSRSGKDWIGCRPGNIQCQVCPNQQEEQEGAACPGKPCGPACPERPEAPQRPDGPVRPERPEAPQQPETPEAPQKPQLPDTDSDGSGGDASLSGYEQQVADLVNKERQAAGLPALKVNTKLARVAERKAEDMRDNNYFSHTSPTYGSPFDMMRQFGIRYTSAGENIAKGQKSPQSVMKGWMNSQGHKDNILDSKYTEIGVGYVTDGSGNTYWVQMFIRP